MYLARNPLVLLALACFAASAGATGFPNKAPDIQSPALYGALAQFFDNAGDCRDLDEQSRAVFDEVPAGVNPPSHGSDTCEKARAFKVCVIAFRQGIVAQFGNLATTCQTDPANCAASGPTKD